MAKEIFTGKEDDLKEAAVILIKLRQATADYKRTYLKPEQEKMKRWEQRADTWITNNIKK